MKVYIKKFDLYIIMDKPYKKIGGNKKMIDKQVEAYNEGIKEYNEYWKKEKEKATTICKDCDSYEGTLKKEFDNEKSYSWGEVAEMIDVCVSCGSENLKEIKPIE